VPEEELATMLRSGQTQQQIADYYGCSVDTIQRRIKQYGLSRNTAANTAK
jgi:DNA-binding CsgD family transcriptional regulator